MRRSAVCGLGARHFTLHLGFFLPPALRRAHAIHWWQICSKALRRAHMHPQKTQKPQLSPLYSPKARWKSFETFGACDLGKMSTGKNLQKCPQGGLWNKRFFPVAFFLDHTLQRFRKTSSGPWVPHAGQRLLWRPLAELTAELEPETSSGELYIISSGSTHSQEFPQTFLKNEFIFQKIIKHFQKLSLPSTPRGHIFC